MLAAGIQAHTHVQLNGSLNFLWRPAWATGLVSGCTALAGGRLAWRGLFGHHEL
ncbi:MAG: hypothetical protein JO057_16500 [Chloroflexi bacterium]|nr:hypothetical protein [Chloroflexota bacterium]